MKLFEHYLNIIILEDYYKPKSAKNFLNNNSIENETNSDRNRNLSLDQYLNKIKPYLTNIIADLQNYVAQKTQLTIAINFISLKDAEEKRVMHSRSDNIKFTSHNNVSEVADQLFDSIRSDFVLDSV